MSILECIRPELQSLRPYQAAEQVDDTIRLNANEVPWSTSGENYRRPLNRYPEVRPGPLGKVLADAYGCAPGNLVITRGTSEGIDLLIRIFCRAGQDSIVTTTPTFSMYRHYARVQGAKVLECPTAPDNDFAVDPDALLRVCDDSTRIVFICSPNNPTGNTVARTDLKTILEHCQGHAAVVVDEAYIEFSEQRSVVDLLADFDNLVVLRTLSKALACAGARCGSVIAAVPVARVLAAVQAPYALSTPVVECVENALEDGGFDKSRQWIGEAIQERKELVARLAEFDFVEKIWPSDANFFLIRVADAKAVVAHCAAHGILIRNFADDLVDCIRITVGSHGENQRLLDVLGSYTGANP